MPNKSIVSRRAILGWTGAVLAAVGFAGRADALTDVQATGLIDRLVADLNGIINSAEPEAAMYRDFEILFNKYGDVPIIARSSMGITWRSASASQKKRYTAAFSGYMARKYGNRFRIFIGGKITVTGTRKVKSGYLVTSVASLKGQSPFVIEWQVSDRSGQDKMFNLFIEGISLLATERTEVAAMLDKRHGDIEGLIVDVNDAR